MTYEIKPAEIKRHKEHCVVYINGEFYCTADNMKEAAKEVEEYFKGGNRNESHSA